MLYITFLNYKETVLNNISCFRKKLVKKYIVFILQILFHHKNIISYLEILLTHFDIVIILTNIYF